MAGLESLIGNLAQQALGMQGQQNNPMGGEAQGFGGAAQNLGGLGGILGGLLGGQHNQNQTGMGGLGGLGSMLGGGTSGGLGGILGSVLGGQNSSRSSALMLIVVPMVLSWIQRNGGLSGALDKLRGHGLADQTQSWVGQDANQEIDASHVQNLFDEQEIKQVAEQANTSPEQVYGAIASVLPEVVNSLTPQGEKSDHNQANNEIGNVLGSLGSLLGR